MSHTNNANAEMIIKTHPTSGDNHYEARLGFSSDGSLQYMPVNTNSWKTIAYTTSDITGKSGSAGYAASAAQATYAASAGYSASAAQATHSASANYAASAARATYAASANYAASAAQATHSASANYAASAAQATHAASAGYALNAASAGYAATANTLGTANVGNYLNPIYLNAGAATASKGNTIPFVVGTGTTDSTAKKSHWAGTLDGLTAYYDGLLILYKIPVAGQTDTYLKLNDLEEKQIYINNTTKLTTHFPVNQPILLVYSASQNTSGCWMCLDDYWTNSNTVPAAYSGTAAATAAYTASCDYWTATANSYLHFDIGYANTSKTALTMNVNGTGAKPVYINGTASSATNYTLPAGSYIAFYDGTNFQFRTDGYLPGLGTIGKASSAGYAASATYSSSAGYAASAARATYAASAGYAASAARATYAASAGYAASAARATYAAKAAITSTTNSVAYYSDAAGTFASDADFLWDATNNKLTALNLNGYVMAGQKSGTTLGSKATAEGNTNTASGYYSHAEGFNNVVSGTASHAEGYFNNVSGLYAHAEGSQTTASAAYVHTEGYQTIASAQYAHAEGQNTTASGQQSHSEGYKTKASGQYSHTEGFQTVASGQASHAMGYDTIASGNYQTVFGKYNLPGSLYAEIVGIGSTSAARANGRTLDWYGNEILSGGLTTPKLIGSGETLYGETLPETGTEGQVFFQLSDGYVYEIPTGGAVDDILVKNSATDRDVVWTRDYVKSSGDTMTGSLYINTKGDGTVAPGMAPVPLRLSPHGGVYGNLGTANLWYCGGDATIANYHPDSLYIGYSGNSNLVANQVWGAVWNDYAECRITKEDIEPGRCIKEVGDDTLELTTERLMRGCEIVSDTFGFAIGQSEIAKTPTAASGRVLAYLYEDREEAKQKIGWPVCSGPNGTVSIMTEEEEEKYPSRIIGTISAVPDYDIWYGGADNDNPIQVNGRVWIRVK